LSPCVRAKQDSLFRLETALPSSVLKEFKKPARGMMEIPDSRQYPAAVIETMEEKFKTKYTSISGVIRIDEVRG
jgi:hypothetical protein